jgi:hypothetical protein
MSLKLKQLLRHKTQDLKLQYDENTPTKVHVSNLELSFEYKSIPKETAITFASGKKQKISKLDFSNKLGFLLLSSVKKRKN